MDAEIPFDVAVVGGGLAGAALARALAGERIVLVSRERRPPSPGTAFDSRVYAISPGNASFLGRLGAWHAIPETDKTPVYAMRVFGDDGASRIDFDAYRTGVPELAWIVEDGRMQDALWRGLEAQEGLALRAQAKLEELRVGDGSAELSLEALPPVRARLVVGADGADSFVREHAGLGGAVRAYGHAAVVANFACTRAHRNVAWQWFRGDSVLALLPMRGEHVSMVWSLPEAEASRVRALEPEALAREAAIASHGALGELSVVTPARAFPLRRFKAPRTVAPRVALAGDAAHIVHPLAGQGANLGLQDARVLAEVLREREPGRDPGDRRLLRRYERARAEAILAMGATVHGLFLLFGEPSPAVARLRNAGLRIANRLPVLKNLLMRHAMG